MKPRTKTRLAAARSSWTVWFAAAVPALLACATALQDQLPILKDLMGPWGYVALSVIVSTVVAILRVRSAEQPGA